MSGTSSSSDMQLFSPTVGQQQSNVAIGTLNRFTTRLQADKTGSSVDSNNNSATSSSSNSCSSSSGVNTINPQARIKLVRGQPGLLSAVEREGNETWILKKRGCFGSLPKDCEFRVSPQSSFHALPMFVGFGLCHAFPFWYFCCAQTLKTWWIGTVITSIKFWVDKERL